MHSAYGNTRQARRLVQLALYISGLVLFLVLCALCAHTANLLWLVVLMLAADVGVAVYAVSQGVLFELLQERTWKAVCGGVGFSGQARSFRGGVIGAYKNGDTKTIYPKFRCCNGTREAFVAIITPFAGQTIQDFSKEADAFALAFHVPFVTFELAENGLIRLRCGPVQVPEAYEYQPVVKPFDVGSVLQAVPMARDINYKPFYLPIEGNHLLIVGRTGSGKGSWVWSLVFGLSEPRKAGLVRFWGLDPKRVELAYGREWWDEYADTTESMVELLEKAVSELLDRNAAISGQGAENPA